MHRELYRLNTLDLLPCTMENGVFLTNVKWNCIPSHQYFSYLEFCSPKGFYSPQLVLHDPIKNKPIKIQLRLIKKVRISKSDSCFYELEFWQDNEWKFYASFYDQDIKRGYDFIIQFSNNFYYGSKSLVDDLRQYLAPIQGKTIAFGDLTFSTQKCSNETFLAFIEKEYNENFIIECQGKEFKIKKIILRARSSVFETMLSTNFFTEGQQNRMVINDCCSKIVKKMIEFFETDFVRKTNNCEVELYEIARKYMCQSFLEFTRLPFVNCLTIRKYDKFLRIAQKHDDKETEELMNEWISKKVNEHWCTII